MEPQGFYHEIRRPAVQEPAKTVAVSQLVDGECSAQFIAGLDDIALVDYLRSHPVEGCLDKYLWTFDEELATVFTDANLQTVFRTVSRLSDGYDGTNALGLHQLWFFAHVAYFHGFYRSEISLAAEETRTAHIAASAAFAANSHIYDLNEEAAAILGEWLIVTDSDGLRHRHLVQIKRVLLNMTPERAGSDNQVWAYNNVFFLLFRGVVNNDAEYLQAIANDGEIVSVLQQAATYDFLNSAELDYLLENAIRELARLAAIEDLQVDAVAALVRLLEVYPRLSGPFLIVVKNLEEHIDCETLDICRQDVVDEITASTFPHRYVFDDGRMIVETSLDTTAIQLLYHAAKQVQSQFFRLSESTAAVADDVNETIVMKIYGTSDEYQRFHEFLFGLSTNSGGIYIERNGTFYTYQRTPLESIFTLEELFRHEYVHYLFARFLHEGLWGQTELYEECRMTWFDEGLAEFLAASTQVDGVPVRRRLVSSVISDRAQRLTTEQVMSSCYSDGFKFYRYAGLYFNYLHQHRRGLLLNLIEAIRNSDVIAYDSETAALSDDVEMERNYQSFIDEQVARIDDLSDPSTSFPRLPALSTDSVVETEAVFRQTSGDGEASCAVSATHLNHRFACSGELSALAPILRERAPANSHFNGLLNGMIESSVADGRINNFDAMNCHFTDVLLGDLPTAPYYCEGPLRSPDVRLDSDSDGIADNLDDFPDDYLGWSDDDADGVLDPGEIPDLDMDGMPDGFERAFGLDPRMAGDAGEDADGDRISNLLEFLHGTDPLDPSSTPPAVNLTATLRNDSGNPTVNSQQSLIFYAGLRFSGDRATNVQLSYTSSVAIRLERTSVTEGFECVVAESDDFGGTIDCGELENGSSGIDLFLHFTPLESGELDFEANFSAAEIELNADDNRRQIVGILIEPEFGTPIETAGLADFNRDGLVDFADFFVFAEAFDGTNQKFDLDGSRIVDFADFFAFADHFAAKDRVVLIELARQHISLPSALELQQNFPNPFNASTTIRFLLVEPGPVRLDVFDLAGQNVTSLVSDGREAGVHSVGWNGLDRSGRRLASGTYIYVLKAGGEVERRKLLVLR